MSGREKIWYDGKVIWIRLPDEPEDQEEPEDLWPDLMLALEVLTPKQRFVIECLYGLRGEPLKRIDVAELMGVSQPAVSQIEDRAIERMRRYTSAFRG